MSGLTIDDPVTLATALSSKRIIPGDVLLLRGGTYSGDYIMNRSGSDTLPITLKAYPGESVIIDGSLTITASYVHLRDLEFTDSRTDRHTITPGITADVEGLGVFGCLIHDLHFNGIEWYGSGVGEISENVIYNNGYRSEDNSQHAHGIYTHNNQGGLRKIYRNIFTGGFGDYNIQIYSDFSNALKNYHVVDNISSVRGIVAGYGLGLTDFILDKNCQFDGNVIIGHGPDGVQEATITNNVFIELVGYDCKHLSMADGYPVETDNLAYNSNGYVWPYQDGYTQTLPPATWSKFTAFTESSKWIASLAIYNRDSNETVAIDFTDKLDNGNYRLRNAENMTETWEFTMKGSSVNIPMTGWTHASRIGDRDVESTTPVFGTFVIEIVS